MGLKVYARGMERGGWRTKERQVYRERRCPSGKGVGLASARKKQIKNADYAEGAKKEKAGSLVCSDRSLLAVMSERWLVW